MLSLLLHWLTQMSSFAPEGSCTCWLCKVPALITRSTDLLLQKWLASKSSALVPSCNILNSGFHYFPFLSLAFCYQYLLCLVKYWPRDHFVTVNLDNLDSPRKCASVASTLAPLRASLWWTFQHAPRWRMFKWGQLLWKKDVLLMLDWVLFQVAVFFKSSDILLLCRRPSKFWLPGVCTFTWALMAKGQGEVKAALCEDAPKIYYTHWYDIYNKHSIY